MVTKKPNKKLSFILILAVIALVFVLFIITPVENPLVKQENTTYDSNSSSSNTGSQGTAGITALGLDEALALPAFTQADIIIEHTGYTLCYCEDDEQPYWVAYILTANEVFSSVAQRANNFHEDPYIPTGSATLLDYKGSGYDRGHMIPAADLKWSEQAMDDSFYMSNMSPQVPSFNRGIWGDLEAVVRTFAVQNKAICVVTGPVLTDGPYDTIGENKVAVPKFYFKAILDYTKPEYKAIGFLLANEGSKESLTSFAVTIDELEEITGFDFFPLLPDEDEAILESTYDVSLWDFTPFNSKTMAQKYSYDVENGCYIATGNIISDTGGQAQSIEREDFIEPQTFSEKFFYFLYEYFRPYKIIVLDWFDGLRDYASSLIRSLKDGVSGGLSEGLTN